MSSPEHPSFQCLGEQIASEFKPSEQLALLMMRRDDLGCRLAIALVPKLMSSTVRAGYADRKALAEKNLCRRDRRSWRYVLTERGRGQSDSLVRWLAEQHGVTAPEPPRRRGLIRVPAMSDQWNG